MTTSSNNVPSDHNRSFYFRWLLSRRLWLVIISFAILLSYEWNQKTLEQHTLSLALERGRYTFKMIQTTRVWLAQHGVAYVARTTETPSNPYLKVAEKNLVTPMGVELTAVNPAYMTRQLAELLKNRHDLTVHMTSLKLLNPVNEPDSWEESVLKRFDKEKLEEVLELIPDNDQVIARYMAPIVANKSCIKCHGDQGYEEGDVRGGVSVSFNYEPFIDSTAAQLKNIQAMHLAAWVVMVPLILLVINLFRKHNDTILKARDEAESLAKERTIDLQKALDEIKILKGIIPICSYCHKIRDDEGAWEQFEQYISKHSDARFSHSVCPSCLPQARENAGLGKDT